MSISRRSAVASCAAAALASPLLIVTKSDAAVLPEADPAFAAIARAYFTQAAVEAAEITTLHENARKHEEAFGVLCEAADDALYIALVTQPRSLEGLAAFGCFGAWAVHVVVDRLDQDFFDSYPGRDNLQSAGELFFDTLNSASRLLVGATS